MSERKVLNKYYPPDFDPSKLPRLKREKNRQFTIRLMAPFNMRCKTCGEYIYRGKKFNARKEDVIGKMHLGIQIYRFYIKCTKCLAEITFLTDPLNQDYEMENGAIRNFESLRLAEKQAENEAKQKKEEEENNPMKILENRTRDSRREMAVLETLEDLRELNTANANVDTAILLKKDEEMKKKLEDIQKEEDEEEIRRIFGAKSTKASLIEEIVGEVIDEPKKSSLKHRLSSDQSESNLKKFKTEEPDLSSFSTFSKAAQDLVKPQTSSSSNQSSNSLLVGKLSKSNVSLFVKKKEVEVKYELQEMNAVAKSAPVIANNQIPPVINPLRSLAAYGDSSDSNDEEN